MKPQKGKNKRFFFLIFTIFFFCFFSKCTYNHFDLNSLSDGNFKRIHIMKNGETIWRISKKYNVPVNEIIRYNNIEDVTDIPVGKKIYIPDDLENQKKYEDTNPNFIWPLQGVISRRFKIEGNIKHAGIDILSSEETPIVAAASGRVIYNGGQMAGYGNLIIIKHSNNLSTVYAHNKINLVNIGEQVTQGQTIAKVGNTGNTSRFHLHFEIRKNDKPIDPELLLPPL